MARDKAVIRDALSKSRICRKCYSTKQLEVHHIIPISAGGPDILDNVDVLCHLCHKEWHRHEGNYELWVTVPPSYILSSALVFAALDEKLKSMTAEEVVTACRQAILLFRELENPEEMY